MRRSRSRQVVLDIWDKVSRDTRPLYRKYISPLKPQQRSVSGRLIGSGKDSGIGTGQSVGLNRVSALGRTLNTVNNRRSVTVMSLAAWLSDEGRGSKWGGNEYFICSYRLVTVLMI
jgi:hypothetical protein